MWELMLTINAEKESVIHYVYDAIKKIKKNDECILTFDSGNDAASVLFACSIEDKPYYLDKIKLAIIDYIINVYKYEFLAKNIHNFMCDEMVIKTFIKVLSLFDKDVDEKVLYEMINLDEKFYIDSFLNFRMAPLLTHWREIAMIAMENLSVFYSNESFIEIMKLLIASMEENCEKIKILFNNGKYSLYSLNGASPEKIEECSGDFSLISSILKACPKFIDVYISSEIQDDIIEFLKNVYDDRLRIFKE